MENTKNQGIGAVVEEVNQLRADELLRNLAKQDINLDNALQELQNIRDFIATPEHILGSQATKHGEIAEQSQVGFENADRLVKGQEATHTFEGVGRTAPEDYLKNGLPVQSKFVQKNLSIDAINEHLTKYPDFLSNGGTYDVPRDYYEKIQEYRNLSPKELNNLPRSEGGDVARDVVRKIKDFEQANNVKFEDVVNPTQATYDEVQLGKVGNTVDKKEQAIVEADESERQNYRIIARYSLKEGLKVAGIAAAIDGVLSFGATFASKFKQGKKLGDFTEDDWKDIFKETGIGVVRGGVTGGSIYALTNMAGMAAPLAAGLVTATYGVVNQAIQLGKGNISTDDFIYNIGQLATDSAVSGLGALAGQMLIPVPVLGAVVGSIVATKVLGIVRETLFGGTYYDLVNKAEYEAAMSSTYRALADSLKRSQQTFETMVRTFVSESQRYEQYKQLDKQLDAVNKNKLRDLLDII